MERELDECHGTTSRGGVYRYYITHNYPYIIGCYKGSVVGSINGRSSQLDVCPGKYRLDIEHAEKLGNYA